MLFAAVPLASAASPSAYTGVVPFWANVSSIVVSMPLSGTTATCKVTINALSETTSIVADVYLYKKTASGGYTLETSWLDESSSSSVFTFSETYTVISGATYKLSVTAGVTRNGTTETVSNSFERTIP
jgi:hypothetical protein